MEVWIGRQGERHGPYQEEQIKEWLRSGQLSRDDLGWYDGLADWQPLSVLFPLEKPTPPPAQDIYAPPPLQQPQSSAPAFAYAGFWKRALAYFIDAFVLYFPFSLLEIPFHMRTAYEALAQQISPGTDPQVALLAYRHFYSEQWPYFLTTLVMSWLYFAICESSSWQATVGKLALGMRVTDLNGARISLGRALGRYGGKFISGLLLCMGFLMVAFTQRKQGLHDMFANTLVLNGRASDVKHNTPPPKDDEGSFHA
ncbi:RDD family protein [Dyella sp. M7H15-1]|uniref:RDD family protein n=1 Tax=Dyella sp. M7H15-1 TaxID=2501295 RepID=UPI0010052100|nr:RDD family protein [Dyella sp. M7H15-1]QAU24156.1 RDD family protein [Dyella sp. M7H15-1]